MQPFFLFLIAVIDISDPRSVCSPGQSTEDYEGSTVREGLAYTHIWTLHAQNDFTNI